MGEGFEGGSEPMMVPEVATPHAGSTVSKTPGRRSVRVASAVAAVVGLTVGSAAIANAVTAPSAPVGHHDPGSHGMSPFGSTPPAAFGKVATVGTNSFTLTTKDGTTVTVNVDASTTYLDHDVATPSFSDVVVGSIVAVVGSDTANTVTATKVIIGVPNHRMGGHHGPPSFGTTPPAAFGKVATVGANTFTLTTKDGTTVTANVDGATTYLDPAVPSPSFSDVTVGALVAVFGTDTSNTVAATKVIVLPVHPSGDGPPATGGEGATTTDPAGDGSPEGSHGVNGVPATMGTVATVGTDAFTVTSFHGTTVTVTVDGSTTYVGHDGASAAFSSIVVGTHVAVFGTNTANTVAATKVFVEAPEAPETSEAPESSASSGAPGTSDGSHGHGGMWGPPPASPPPAPTPSTTEQPAPSAPNQQGDNATGQPWTWGPGHGGSQGGSSTSTGTSSQTAGPGWRGPSGGGSPNSFR